MSNRFQILTYPTLHCSSTHSISISPLSRCLFDHLLLRIEVRQFRFGAMDESWEMFRCSNWLCNWSRIEMKIYLCVYLNLSYDYCCITYCIRKPCYIPIRDWWVDLIDYAVNVGIPAGSLIQDIHVSCMADPDRSSKSSAKINHLKSLRKERVNIPQPQPPQHKNFGFRKQKKHVKGGTVYLNRIGCLGVKVCIASRFASQSSWLHATTALVVWCLDASSTMGQHDWKAIKLGYVPTFPKNNLVISGFFLKGSQVKFVGYVICAFLGIFNFEQESKIPPSIHQVDS